MTDSAAQTPKTLLIVGAGASREFNLPIGSELKNLISSALDIRFKDGYNMSSGDNIICSAFQFAATASNPSSQDINPFLTAGWKVRDAMPQAPSIDNFIDVHSNDKRIELCGKLAIVRTILQAESKSSLFINPTQSERKLNFRQLENTWLNHFMQLLTENCKAVNLEQRLSSVALVIFNYDRCVEHYMYHWLQNYYSINNSLAAKLLQGLEIYHPYGTVGSLPWLNSKNAIEYGATPTPKQLLELASQIKTFTEGTDETSSDVNAIRSHMKMINKLIFLGFAFHKLNMELLIQTGSAKVNGISQSIFATAHGISGSDSEDIRVELSNALSTSKTYFRTDLKCNQLFQEFRRKLSFA